MAQGATESPSDVRRPGTAPDLRREPPSVSRRVGSAWLVTAGGAVYLASLLVSWREVTWAPGIEHTWTPLQLGYQHSINLDGEIDLAVGVALLAFGVALLVERTRCFRTISVPAGALVVSLAGFVALFAEWRYLAHAPVAVFDGAHVVPYISSGYWLALFGTVLAITGALVGISAAATTNLSAFLHWLAHPASHAGASD